MKLLLFDIDGTILLSGGAAMRAINRAFLKFHGVADAINGIRPDGKTDPVIIREMFKNGLARDFLDEESQTLFKEYVILLEEEIAVSPGFRIMVGIPELLKALSTREDILLGVATGNIEEGAWIKLKRAELHNYFKFGGFGSDSENREQLIRVAIERAKTISKVTGAFDGIFVIGDTPYDIIHGKAAGATTVAVATGSYSFEELKKYNPDHLFEDFLDLDSAIKIFG